jgi:hypothetical protein
MIRLLLNSPPLRSTAIRLYKAEFSTSARSGYTMSANKHCCQHGHIPGAEKHYQRKDRHGIIMCNILRNTSNGTATYTLSSSIDSAAIIMKPIYRPKPIKSLYSTSILQVILFELGAHKVLGHTTEQLNERCPTLPWRIPASLNHTVGYRFAHVWADLTRLIGQPNPVHTPVIRGQATW